MALQKKTLRSIAVTASELRLLLIWRKPFLIICLFEKPETEHTDELLGFHKGRYKTLGRGEDLLIALN